MPAWAWSVPVAARSISAPLAPTAPEASSRTVPLEVIVPPPSTMLVAIEPPKALSVPAMVTLPAPAVMAAPIVTSPVL